MLNKMFDEFNNLYGLTTKPIDHNLDSMMEIVKSEVDELQQEVDWSKDPETFKPNDLIKEGIDNVYAQLQQLRERGVDVDAALAEVHRSNMSKELVEGWMVKFEVENASTRYPYVKVEGNVMKCGKTGKVIKPTTYSPAVITPSMWGDKSSNQLIDDNDNYPYDMPDDIAP